MHIPLPILNYPLEGKASVALIMTSQDSYFAQLITTGMTKSKPLLFGYYNVCPNTLFSVRAKLRNGDPGYDFTSSFFLRCLYEDGSGDPDSPDIGFLKGPLLIRVSTALSILYDYLNIETGLGLLPYIYGSFLSHWRGCHGLQK